MKFGCDYKQRGVNGAHIVQIIGLGAALAHGAGYSQNVSWFMLHPAEPKQAVQPLSE